ncbi:MAG: hypothetical protein HFI20_00775 [Lachnospiraceae bacterium]|nr:hypothetical protein [Lachnospiraceae bacterium]
MIEKEYPSWMYQVTQGATTVWEHLDGIRRTELCGIPE